MSVQIRNVTNRPVFMRLNSGRSLHLSPGAASGPLFESEVQKNLKVEKLRARQVIQLQVTKERKILTTPERKVERSEKN